MSTKAPEQVTPTPAGALQVWEPQDVQRLISAYPEDRFIALFPRTVLSQVNPMLTPVIETVVLNPDPENGGDVYQSRDLKANHVALTKVALRRVMSLAGASMIDSRRLDDGSDPWYVLWQVTVERHVPGRPRPERAVGTKEIRLSGEPVKGWSPERLAKAREHMVRMAEAKACNAALRDLLTLKQQYHRDEVRKPFVVLRWEPNMRHPLVAERFLDNLLPATTAAYGPQDAAPRLDAGDDAAAGYELAPKAPDDDEVTEGAYTVVETNGHAKVERATGEVVSSAGPEPDWGFDDVAPSTFLRVEKAPPDESLRERLARVADERPDATAGLTRESPLAGKLTALLRPLHTDKERRDELVTAGLRAAFVGIEKLSGLQERHAQAILDIADDMGDAAFCKAWVAMATAPAGER